MGGLGEVPARLCFEPGGIEREVIGVAGKVVADQVLEIGEKRGVVVASGHAGSDLTTTVKP